MVASRTFFIVIFFFGFGLKLAYAMDEQVPYTYLNLIYEEQKEVFEKYVEILNIAYDDELNIDCSVRKSLIHATKFLADFMFKDIVLNERSKEFLCDIMSS